MSSCTYGVTAKSITAELNGSPTKVRLAKFVCMNNGFFETKKRDTYVNRAMRGYEKAGPAEYFVDDVAEEAPPILSGRVVYRVPEGYRGVHADYEADKFERVGTILQYKTDSGKDRFVIETDLVEVEKLRREREFEKMKEGRLSIGTFGNDVDAYKQSLAERDQESPSGMATRGHGIH